MQSWRRWVRQPESACEWATGWAQMRQPTPTRPGSLTFRDQERMDVCHRAASKGLEGLGPAVATLCSHPRQAWPRQHQISGGQLLLDAVLLAGM